MNFKKCGKWIALALVLFLLASALVPPLFQAEAEASEIPSGFAGERVASVDSNKDAMLWRLRLIRSAEKSLILSTFDLRPDETGLDILAALQEAADRGVQIRLLADGICGAMYLRGSKEFGALADGHAQCGSQILQSGEPADTLDAELPDARQVSDCR